MIDLNSTLLIQMVNFLVLIFVLNVLLYKPIMKVIETRKKRVEGSKEAVDSLDEVVAQKVADYEDKLRQARTEAMNQREAVKSEGTEAGKKILGDARNEITGMVQEFKVKLSKEKDEARSILKDRTREIALEISEKVLGRGVQ